MLKHLGVRFFSPILLVVLLYNGIIFSNNWEGFDYKWDHAVENRNNISNEYYTKDHKQRGMTVFGWSDNNEGAIRELLKNNIEWVAVVPFMFQKGNRTKEMRLPDTGDNWSSRDSSFLKAIEQLHAKKIRVMLKPHLWMNEGWRSNIILDSPEEWNAWFESYRANMLRYAKMAAKTNVDLFCVGTELKSSLRNAPEQWVKLVSEIKSIYDGPLTYAANWDGEFDLVPFWDQMDYIGLQAYFPLTKTSNPDLEAIKKGWARHLVTLETLADKWDKPILFTEVGYRSDAHTTVKPWEWDGFMSVLRKRTSNKTQYLAYEALFQELWHQKWFAGMYIWQWNTRSEPDNSFERLDFSPRHKPAMNNLAKWYGSRVD